MYPLKFKPILKTLVWGGDKIAPFKGIETDQHNIGESWELSGVKGNESVVANGKMAGKTITELVIEYKDQLIGKKNYEKTGTEFPILIKFIDAKQDLSIQVHPDDNLAAKNKSGMKGKTEMWYVVSTDDNAHLISGLSKSIIPEEYEAMVSDNTITEALHDYKISPGDVFYIPAGRIHSIGAGSFITEIQQTSDLTYRIYDFGRLGLDGKPRELHTGLAKEAIDYSVYEDYRTHYMEEPNKEVCLVDCRYFTTSLLFADKPFVKDLSTLDSFLVIICIDGNGIVSDDKGNHEPFHRGETLLIPASTESIEIVPDNAVRILTSFVEPF